MPEDRIQAESVSEQATGEKPAGALRDLLTFRGRINRASFLNRNLASWFFCFAALGVRSLFRALFPRLDDPISTTNLLEAALALFWELLFLTAGIWIALAAWARRWHDLGLFGGLSLLSFIPFVDFAVFVYLLFAPGKPGPNRYGPPLTPFQPLPE